MVEQLVLQDPLEHMMAAAEAVLEAAVVMS
jgi:hypothetical protein